MRVRKLLSFVLLVSCPIAVILFNVQYSARMEFAKKEQAQPSFGSTATFSPYVLPASFMFIQSK